MANQLPKLEKIPEIIALTTALVLTIILLFTIDFDSTESISSSLTWYIEAFVQTQIPFWIGIAAASPGLFVVLFFLYWLYKEVN